VGDIVHTATGPVDVVRLECTHGGIEALVRTAGNENGGERILWWWPQQGVRVAAPDVSGGRP
jgi:hypothetical protein